MSEYQFKNLSDATEIQEPSENTTLMGFENGNLVQLPANSIKGNTGVFLINPDDPDYSTTDTAYGDKVKEALLAGKPVWMYRNVPSTTISNGDMEYYNLVCKFDVATLTNGGFALRVYTSASSTIPAANFDITAS